MKAHSRSALLLLIALSVPAACAAHSQNRSDASAATGLTVVASDGVQRLSAGVARFDFGNVDSLASAAITHTFILANSSKTRLVIERVQPTCGCTTVLLQTKNGSSAGADLAPGEQVSLRATVALDQIRSGPISKYVYVFALGSSTPAATLELRGNLQELISFTPQIVNFGAVGAGVQHTIAVTARINRRLLDKEHAVELVCSAPDVRISELPGNHRGSEGDRDVRNYAVTLPADARLGELHGSLYFKRQVVETAPAPRSMRQPVRLADEGGLGGAYAPLTGAVIGDIAAMPRAMVFGSFYAGQAQTREIAIQAKSPGVLKGLQAECAESWISAKCGVVNETAPNGMAGAKRVCRRALTVTVAANAPEGGHEVDITVKTANGQRLVIPTYVNVVRPTAGAHSR